jgi:hypothetical protein
LRRYGLIASAVPLLRAQKKDRKQSIVETGMQSAHAGMRDASRQLIPDKNRAQQPGRK